MSAPSISILAGGIRVLFNKELSKNSQGTAYQKAAADEMTGGLHLPDISIQCDKTVDVTAE